MNFNVTVRDFDPEKDLPKKPKVFLQVQYIRYWTVFHLCLEDHKEKCLCGKSLGIAVDLFPLPDNAAIEKCCGCKTCLKVYNKIDRVGGEVVVTMLR